MRQGEMVEALPNLRLLQNGEEGGNAGAGAEHDKVAAVGEAFGQQEAGGGFVEQDGAAGFHLFKPGRHGAAFDEHGEVFEGVVVFGGNHGIGAPDEAAAFGEAEAGKLAGGKAVFFGAADGKTHQLGCVAFYPEYGFFCVFGGGRGTHDYPCCVGGRVMLASGYTGASFCFSICQTSVWVWRPLSKSR